MLLYLCLSGHGYGHAARQASVLVEIQRLRPDWRIVISTAFNYQVLSQFFSGIIYEYRNVQWDVGMMQSNAYDVDLTKTIYYLKSLEEKLPCLISKEISWLQLQEEPIIILGDIPPAAADIAEALNVPLIWMANFGWDDIYEPLGGEFSYYASLAKENYEKGNKLLRCPFSLSMDWSIEENSLSLTVSKPKKLDDDLISHLSSYEDNVVMVGFGGLGFNLNLELFKEWPNHLFIITNPIGFNSINLESLPDNIICLPESTRVIDVLPFCSRQLSKPGYSSFCEAISQDVGLHVCERQDFEESRVLIEGLRKYGLHRIITRKALESGDWELDKPLISHTNGNLKGEGSISAAQAIINSL